MKELPYFKFFTGEYLTGEITVCDMRTQGVFVNICCYYWNRQGNYPVANAKHRFSEYKAEIDNLIDLDILKVEEGHFIIEFLDEQLVEMEKLHQARVDNGRKGGLASHSQAKLKPHSSKTKPIREDKIKIRKEYICEKFNKFWDLYDKKVGDKKKLLKKFSALSDKDISAIMKFIPKYKDSQPNKKYRKNPETFLNNKSWLDEIINNDTDNHSVEDM